MRILCADVGGTSIKLGISDEYGVITEFKEVPTESIKGGNYVMEKLIASLSEYEDFESIGISTAGQVDRLNGSIIYANENIPGYTGMQVKKILEEKFNKQVEVENDVNCAGLGEARFGSGKDFSNFLCLTYGTGIGGSIILNHEVFRGSFGLAGEFGHIVTHPDGLPCNCGHFGCYEVYASTTALVREAMRMDNEVVNGRVFFDKIHANDEQMVKILDNWAKEVAYGLVSLIHIFNPQAIVLGGGILEQETALERIEYHTRKLTMDSFQQVRFIKASLGNKAGLLGASSLHLN
ncbi:MAG: ROK family protein [Clostridiaceae bacterium]